MLCTYHNTYHTKSLGSIKPDKNAKPKVVVKCLLNFSFSSIIELQISFMSTFHDALSIHTLKNRISWTFFQLMAVVPLSRSSPPSGNCRTYIEITIACIIIRCISSACNPYPIIRTRSLCCWNRPTL